MESLRDHQLRNVLVVTMSSIAEHHERQSNRWPYAIDVWFVAYTLHRVFQDRGVLDVLRGEGDKHRWFDDEPAAATSDEPRCDEDSHWGFRHRQAYEYVQSTSNAILKDILLMVLTKAITLQIIERVFPSEKIDLLFIVESLGESLTMKPEILASWTALADR